MVDKILETIEADNIPQRSLLPSDAQKLSSQFFAKVLREKNFPYQNCVVISVRCDYQPYICFEKDLYDNHYAVPVYETSEKDSELHTLALLLEYLALEDDIRPVLFKFHTYPVTFKGETMEGLVETDDDILALYNPKSQINSVLETDGDYFSDKEKESRSIIQKPISVNELIIPKPTSDHELKR